MLCQIEMRVFGSLSQYLDFQENAENGMTSKYANVNV